jgi:hypothetical protein
MIVSIHHCLQIVRRSTVHAIFIAKSEHVSRGAVRGDSKQCIKFVNSDGGTSENLGMMHQEASSYVEGQRKNTEAYPSFD